MITVVPPREPYLSDPLLLRALMLYREGRGVTDAAKLGISRVVDNRCALAPLQGFKASPTDNILHPGAFSSFNQGNSQSILYPVQLNSDGSPNAEWPAWMRCLAVAQSDEADPTGGAVFYYSAPLTAPPAPAVSASIAASKSDMMRGCGRK